MKVIINNVTEDTDLTTAAHVARIALRLGDNSVWWVRYNKYSISICPQQERK